MQRVIVPCFAHQYKLGVGVRVCIYMYMEVYPVDFLVHYNIHYITFTILVRETWNDYHAE
jgi:hypothetical protein